MRRIFAEADDLDALRQQIRDAIACHFEPSERPRLVRLHIVHEEVLPVADWVELFFRTPPSPE